MPPSGVISLLDGATEAKVVEIMGELRTRHWMPHITLAQHDVPVAVVPEITSWLATRELAWEIAIDTLAFAHWNGARYDVERHRLSGR